MNRGNKEQADGSVGAIGSSHELGFSRRQLLTAGAGAAGVVAGAGILRGNPALAAGHPVGASVRRSAASPSLLPMTMAITGQVQGKFPGQVIETLPNRMVVYDYEFAVTIPIDAGSGLPSGKRTYHPVKVVKPVDVASPLIWTATATDETLVKVEIDIYQRDPAGKLIHFQNVELTNGTLNSAEQFVTYADQYFVNSTPIGSGQPMFLEELTFYFEKVSMKNLPGKTVFSDDWESTFA